MTDLLDDKRLDRLREQKAIGQEAAHLLKNPLIRGAFERMQREVLTLIAKAPLTESKEHAMLILAFQQLERLERCFLDHIKQGEAATEKLIDAAQYREKKDMRSPLSRLINRRAQPL